MRPLSLAWRESLLNSLLQLLDTPLCVFEHIILRGIQLWFNVFTFHAWAKFVYAVAMHYFGPGWPDSRFFDSVWWWNPWREGYSWRWIDTVPFGEELGWLTWRRAVWWFEAFCRVFKAVGRLVVSGLGWLDKLSGDLNNGTA